MLGDLNIDRVNQLISRVSDVSTRLLSERTLVESQLFNVTAYNCLACFQLYNGYQYSIMRELAKHIDPAEIGRRSKTLAMVPNTLGMWAFIGLYMIGRMQTLWELGGPENEPEERKKEVNFMLDFWQRMASAYFDGHLFADDNQFRINVLPGSTLKFVKENLMELDRERVSKLKRVMAQLQLTAFLYYCECRASIHEMGPYRIGEDEILIFREFSPLWDGTNLKFEWGDLDAKSPLPNVCFALTLKGIESAEFTDYGTMFIKPQDYTNNIRKVAIFTRRGEKVEPVGLDILDPLNQFATDAQSELYLKFAEWPEEMKILSGAQVFTTYLFVFTDLAGITNKFKFGISEETREKWLPKVMNEWKIMHPSWARIFRPKEEWAKDPTFYWMVEK